MKYKGFDDYQLERGEPVWRSCWECNSAHEHLEDTNLLHWCFNCGRYWIFGHYIDEFDTAEALHDFLRPRLLGEGE
jgi:hypothetical protein